MREVGQQLVGAGKNLRRRAVVSDACRAVGWEEVRPRWARLRAPWEGWGSQDWEWGRCLGWRGRSLVGGVQAPPRGAGEAGEGVRSL